MKWNTGFHFTKIQQNHLEIDVVVKLNEKPQIYQLYQHFYRMLSGEVKCSCLNDISSLTMLCFL